MAPDEKFGKSEHILKTGDFAVVYKKGRAARSDLIFLHYLANGLSRSRIGFSISSGRIALATGRNRIRRILREVFRRNKFFFKPGYDIVVVVKKNPGKKILYKDLEGLFLKLIRAAGLSS
jgi:ribonuclease P protein component